VDHWLTLVLGLTPVSLPLPFCARTLFKVLDATWVERSFESIWAWRRVGPNSVYLRSICFFFFFFLRVKYVFTP